jgi:hypothetical protein
VVLGEEAVKLFGVKVPALQLILFLQEQIKDIIIIIKVLAALS